MFIKQHTSSQTSCLYIRYYSLGILFLLFLLTLLTLLHLQVYLMHSSRSEITWKYTNTFGSFGPSKLWDCFFSSWFYSSILCMSLGFHIKHWEMCVTLSTRCFLDFFCIFFRMLKFNLGNFTEEWIHRHFALKSIEMNESSLFEYQWSYIFPIFVQSQSQSTKSIFQRSHLVRYEIMWELVT